MSFVHTAPPVLEPSPETAILANLGLPPAAIVQAIANSNAVAPAGAVDWRPGPGRNDGRDNHCHGKRAEYPYRRQAEVFGHGYGQNGRNVVAGGPTYGEGRAEGRDDR